MTDEQRAKIEELRNDFYLKVKYYSTYSGTKFNVFSSNNENDKNITIIYTIITGLNDSYQPFYENQNILIEPNGNAINLMDFYSDNDVLTYIENLKKIG